MALDRGSIDVVLNWTLHERLHGERITPVNSPKLYAVPDCSELVCFANEHELLWPRGVSAAAAELDHYTHEAEAEASRVRARDYRWRTGEGS